MKHFSWGLFAITLGSLFLRYRSAWGDLWLDEIWSLKMALTVRNGFEILTSIHHDNNHYINTFILYLLGEQADGLIYRIPACIAGAVTVWLAGAVINCKNAVEKYTTALVFGFSYWLIHYSSEARGYAYLPLFVLLSIAALKQYFSHSNRRSILLFSFAAIMGFLSHLTFVHAYAGFIVWTIWTFKQEKKSSDLIAKETVALFGPSFAFLMLLWIMDLRYLQIGGGDVQPVWNVVLETAGWAVGGGIESAVLLFSLLVFIAVAIIFAKKAIGKNEKDWPLFLVGILISPAFLVIATQPPFLYPRYFIVSTVLFLLLLSRYLAAWLSSGGATRVVAAVIMVLFFAFNFIATADLWKVGRGNYSAALDRIQKDSRDPKMSVGSDHDFRNSTLLGYYSRFFPTGKTISYYPQGSWSATEPEWVLHHQFDPTVRPGEIFDTEKSGKYKLEGFYPSSRLSGWSWALYQRIP